MLHLTPAKEPDYFALISLRGRAQLGGLSVFQVQGCQH